MPYYRQQYGFVRIGAEISRQDMTNWTMKVAGQLGPLIELIKRTIREGAVIGAISIAWMKTPVKILEHPKTGKAGQGNMWVARGGPKDKPAVRYRFAGGRGSQNVRSFLGDWDGFIQTDGYSAYETALVGTTVRHVGCWAG